MGFGEYALVRRAVSFMEPVLLMGLSVGLTRYIAISSTTKEDAALKTGCIYYRGI